MTLMTMCALTPHLCLMGADPAVRQALAALAGDSSAQAMSTLRQAMMRFPEDAAAALALLGGDAADGTDISRCFSHEALAFFHVCGQCSAGEVLDVLTKCVHPPDAQGLAALIGERRRMMAMARYGLQLLWRLCGDETLPDALTVFPEDGSRSSAGSVVAGLVRELKGGAAHE